MYERRYGSKVRPLHREVRQSHVHITPGCLVHKHPRQAVVFNNKTADGIRGNVNQLYWRLHKTEYEATYCN